MEEAEALENMLEMLEDYREQLKDRSIGEVLAIDRPTIRYATAMIIKKFKGYVEKDGLDLNEAIIASMMWGMYVSEMGASRLIRPHTPLI